MRRTWDAYKIYDTVTGLYSRGGSSGCTYADESILDSFGKREKKRYWSTVGKVWSTMGFLKAHLAQYPLTLESLPARYKIERAHFATTE